MKIGYKIIYNDYEVYNVEIENNNYKTLILDDQKETDNIYLQDANKNKYIWFGHIYLENELKINKGQTKNIMLKFNKEYKPTLDAKKMVFGKIIVDNNKKLEVSIDM